MERIYHLTLPALWEEAPNRDYRTASLSSEGFIHCSLAAQAARSANRFFADAGELLLLEIDPARLSSPLRYEAARPSGPGAPKEGELFPHVYGPINRSAVVAVHVLKRDDSGCWVFP